MRKTQEKKVGQASQISTNTTSLLRPPALEGFTQYVRTKDRLIVGSVGLKIMESTPLIGPPRNADHANSEANTRVNSVGVEITSTFIASDSHLHEKSISSDRFLFDAERFLEGGALDDVFGIIPDTASTPIRELVSDGSKWEVTKLSGGLINITLRVIPRRRDDKPESPRSVVIKYAPPFMAAIGESAPFGTFRQVSTIPCFLS
jgi:hypothetical protein